MGADFSVPALKRTLLEEVRNLFHRNGSLWKEPILDVLQDLRRLNVRAVLFGGTLRSLLVSRLFEGRPGRPRDVDVVISGTSLSQVEEQFNTIVTRRTRFGGLQMKRGPWQFDVWPVTETWAFRQEGRIQVGFAQLPSTTAFNLEAVAVEAWSTDGRPRALFSGDDQFFEGILSKTIELNRLDSSFPELTVVRALVLASELKFKVGPRLARYIRDHGSALTQTALERVQISHYGHCRLEGHTLMGLIAAVGQYSSNGEGCELPLVGQLHLWRHAEELPAPRMNLHGLGD